MNITKRPLEADKYRCTIIQMYRDRVTAFQATTVPGAYYTQNAENDMGAARLMAGLWSFKRGLHKGNPALVQNSSMLVLRDTDQDYDMDFDSDYLQSGFFGINNHAGGGSDSIGKWSAGCQVIRGEVVGGQSLAWNSKQWLNYKNRAYQASNSVYQYLLMPYDWVEIVSAGKKAILMIGSKGNAVSAIQSKLGLKIDQNYGEFTARAVMKFQKANGIQPNGCVGPQTATAMGISL